MRVVFVLGVLAAGCVGGGEEPGAIDVVEGQPTEPVPDRPGPAPPPDPDDMEPWEHPSADCAGHIPPDASARELNSRGMDCYRAGEMHLARDLFAEATERGEHALAHYNLACAILLLRRDGGICQDDAYLDTALSHLVRSVEIDADRRRRLPEDPDLEEARKTLRYQVALGLDLSDDDALRRALPGLVFHTPGQGAFGSMRRLTFQEGGTLQVGGIEFVEGQDAPVEIDETGTWRVEGGRIHLSEGDAALLPRPDGTLRRSPDGPVVYQDHPSECSA